MDWFDTFNNNNNNHHQKIDIIAALRKTPFLKELLKKELFDLAKIIYIRYFEPDEIIYHQNEPGMGFYIVNSGSVKFISHSSANGAEYSIILTESDFFGELSLLDDKPRMETVIALDNCCLLAITRPDLFRLIDRNPRTGSRILVKLNQLIINQLQQKNAELWHLKENLANSNFIQ